MNCIKKNEAWNKLLAVDKELSETKGFENIDSLPKYDRAYTDWQYHAGNYNGFISWLRGREFNLNDEI